MSTPPTTPRASAVTPTGSLRAVAATERDERRVLVIARDYAQAWAWAAETGLAGSRFLWVHDDRHLYAWGPRTATIRALDVPAQGWSPRLGALLAQRIAQGMTCEGAPSVIAALTAVPEPVAQPDEQPLASVRDLRRR